MQTIHELTGREREHTPFGKIMGVVRDREQLRHVSTALVPSGVQDIDVMAGPGGVLSLGQERDDAEYLFLGDVEPQMAQRYLNAVNDGLIVFAAVVPASRANEAAERAKAEGASDVVHFGAWVITNY